MSTSFQKSPSLLKTYTYSVFGLTSLLLLGGTIACGAAPDPDEGVDLGSGGQNAAAGASSGGAGAGTGAGGVGFPGSGGAMGVGGAQGSGGVVVGAGGAAGGGGGGGTTTSCGITVGTSETASLMPTVGLVDFSTDLAGATSAHIEFGLDTSYGMVAPAEAGGTGFETTLIGMKPDSTYHYKVVVSNGTESCESADQTIMTGGLRQGVPKPQANVQPGTAPGFVMTTSGSSVLIMDRDGDVVWGYTMSAGGGGGGPMAGVFSAKMSWDRKWVYFRDLGPFNYTGNANIWRVSLDGSTEELLPLPGGHHHDLTVTPDGIAYISKEMVGGCDHIYLADHDGSNARSLVDSEVVFNDSLYPEAGGGGGMGEACHGNAINYHHDAGIFTLSDREKDAVAVFDTSGNPVKAIGKAPMGNPSFEAVTAEGGGTTWRVQHGHHYYADDKFMVFSNGSFGGGTSKVIHYTLSGTSASIDWEYDGAGQSGTQGDVEYLPNGNVLITASNAGNMHEIDTSQQLIASYKFSSLGYTIFYESLYGEPAGR